jgi:hypothetical protein
MRRWIPAFVLFAIGLGMAAPADAQHQQGFFYRSKIDWHRVNCWPEPFIYADREAVYAPFHAMVQAGWRRHNTMGDIDFDRNTHELTEAGRYKLQWILTQAPVEHRTVFVLTGPDRQVAALRLASVQRESVSFMPPGGQPVIFETNVEPRTTPADYIDDIYTKVRTTTPSPRIAPVSDGGGT